MKSLNDTSASSRGRCQVSRVALLAALPLALTGCASFSPDQGMGDVAAIVSDGVDQSIVKIRNSEEAHEAETRVRELLKRPLTADRSVQIALLNNKGLQAAYNELAIIEANGVEASLPPSPTLSLARLTAGPEFEIERMILVNVLGMLTLPAKREIAERQFRQAQFAAATETLRIAVEAKRAFYQAVASFQTVTLLAEAKEAAESASELIKRLGESGAVSKLDQAREHVFYAEITGQLARARQDHEADRESLIRVLGLWGNSLRAFKLPASLPELPAKPARKRDIESEALRRRVDVEMARIEVEATAKMLGLTEATRFVNVLEVAGMQNTEKTVEDEIEKSTWSGVELELQIPIFDFGQTRTRRAEETYMQAVNRLAEGAINARSEVREAYQRYRSAYDFARHYQSEIIPLRQTIADESLLRYNGMLTDIFPVLADARARITSNSAAIDAVRDFWLAYTNLHAALLIGGGNSAMPEATASIAAGSGGEEH